MKRNSIVFLSIFVSIQFYSSVYSRTDDLIGAQYTYEPATRGPINDTINTVNDVGKRLKKIDIRTKKIDDTVDDIEDDVKDLIDTSNVIQDKACDIQSIVDDLLECCPCDTIIRQEDIPFTITESGVYCLGENVSLQQEGQTAITIGTECVTLNLKGHAIDGQNKRETLGILIDGMRTFTNNVTISNGIIKNIGAEDAEVEKEVGILVIDSFGPIMITGLKITNCGRDGILIENSSGVVVDNCESSFNGGEEAGGDGVEINNSKQCIVRGCLFRCNGSEGVDVRNNSSDCCVINCKSYQNESGGFRLSDANRCNLISCVAQDNESHGYDITENESESNNNVLLKCIANHNGFDKQGNSVDDVHGFRIRNNENVIRHCVASDNASSGFFIEDSDANDTQVGSSYAIGNGSCGFVDEGTDSFFYNNAANCHTTNFDGLVLTVDPPGANTGFWANVSFTIP